MLNHVLYRLAIIAGFMLVSLCTVPVQAFVCSGSLYNNPSFKERTTDFSPYEKIYLIVECTGLESGEYTMHANWTHKQRGVIRSDKHQFTAEHDRKHGIFFWLKLSKKGPVSSMLTNQDFHEENFGEWVVETYLNDELIVSNEFTITDD